MNLTLKLISDLHVDSYRDFSLFKKGSFVENANEVDALILCGDICNGLTKNKTMVDSLFQILTDKFERVCYVLGNHDYYFMENIEEVRNLTLKMEDKFPNLFIFNSDKTLFIKGVCFIGGTMWYKFNRETLELYEKFYDFKRITNYKEFVEQESNKFREYLLQNIDSETVVMTHHAPSKQSEDFREGFKPLYYQSMESIIQKYEPILWAHGHMHLSNDYRLFNTRIKSNPLGYFGEINPKFDSKELIQISLR